MSIVTIYPLFVRQLSIIIHTKNEGDTIIHLIKRIDDAMRAGNIDYEIIFIDDHSTDITQTILHRLSKLFPVRLHAKKGVEGKVQSLFEGCSYARYPNLAYIDTKEYPPEVLPHMLKKLEEGFDIVVANREEKNHSILKNNWKNTFLSFWGEKIHKLNIDFSSQLKVFKKNVLQRLTLAHMSPASFDMEFLVRARDAGYTITSIPLPFEKNFAEKQQQSLIRKALDIITCAIDLKFANPDVIPFQESAGQKSKGFHLRGKRFTHYSRINISDSAFFRLSGTQKKIIFFIFIIFLASLFISWQKTIIASIALLTIMYFTDLLFNLYLIAQSFINPSEIYVSEEDIPKEKDWPTYTIFCPLYKEGNVLPQFVEAIENLCYPKEKLQVVLLLEEDDPQTINKAKLLHLPTYFEIYVPPHSFPKTKPKALNFGLEFAKGEYCVVYDAEDIPDPMQLKKVIVAFEKANKKVRCIQAKLNFYNPFQNILTRVFTAEYSLWFDLVLTGLQSTHSIIPLGGTSNHFRTNDLQHMKGWDSFNVTEDCDLGLRLAKNGYETGIVNSTTFEEANSNIFNWFKQRGRWIKGYIQTYLVHTRSPKDFIRDTSIQQFIKFQLIVGGKILSLFINPLMWCITIFYFAFRPFLGHFIAIFFPGPILYIGAFSLVFGNFLYLYYYMIGCAKRGQYSLVAYAFLVPLYWLAMSVSGWHAIIKIITEPHYWAKTHHGLHLGNSKKTKDHHPILQYHIPQLSV